MLLVVPWVEPEQQALIFPPGVTFQTREQQAEYILKGDRGVCWKGGGGRGEQWECMTVGLRGRGHH